MAKHPPKKTRKDVLEIAREVVEKAIGENLNGQPLEQPPEKLDTRNPAAVALSKLGASKGGKARAEKLTPRQRSAIAQKAARIRWEIVEQTNGEKKTTKKPKAKAR